MFGETNVGCCCLVVAVLLYGMVLGSQRLRGYLPTRARNCRSIVPPPSRPLPTAPRMHACMQEFAEARLYEIWLKEKRLASRAEVGLVNTEEVSVSETETVFLPGTRMFFCRSCWCVQEPGTILGMNVTAGWYCLLIPQRSLHLRREWCIVFEEKIKNTST